MMSLSSWLIFFFCVQVVHFLGTWRLYQLAGRKAWEAAVPIYNAIVLLKIIQRPTWWVIILFIPIVSPILFMVLWVDLARGFGKRETLHTALSIVTLGGYLAYLNYIEKPKFSGPEDRKETLVSALLYAIVFATVIHTFVIRPFVIPTGSMEKTLRIGDMLFVEYSKYGMRIPFTPVGLPFVPSTLSRAANESESNIKSYIDWIRLPYLRLPGWGEINRNDIVVFNFPLDSIHTAIDRKDPYVKRCLGLPGDTLSLEKGKVYIDGKQVELPEDARVQFPYSFVVNQAFDPVFLKENFELAEGIDYGLRSENEYFFINLDESIANQLKDFPNVLSYKKEIEREVLPIDSKQFDFSSIDLRSVFPYNGGSTEFDFKPIWIPKKGETIRLNEQNINTYLDVITRYEGNTFQRKENRFYINDVPTESYTFLQDYYFMIGDNRGNSLDSRYWGFVPEDHILGRPNMIWASFEGVFNRKGAGFAPRWERFFTIPNDGEKDKRSYFPIVLLMIAAYAGYSFWKGKKKGKS